MPNEQRETHQVAALIELQAHPSWVCWRREERKGKITKVPYTPRTGYHAKSDDPTTWTNYDQALEAWQQHPEQYDGIGYMFHGAVTGIDLDHCIDEHGRVDAWAQAYLDALTSYSEKSPNDEGIHVLVRGALPGKGTRRLLPGQRHPEAAIEMYCEKRYFTVTGKHLAGTPQTLEARQEALNAIYTTIINAHEQVLGNKADQGGAPLLTVGQETELESLPHTDQRTRLDEDTELLRRAGAAANGRKFTDLYTHGTHGSTSASEADLALCTMLAFWTGKDATRIDRLFRTSALYRDKWDEQRGETTYGGLTIAKAISWCNVVFNPRHSKQQLEQDIEHLLARIADQRRVLGTVPARGRKPAQLIPKEVPTHKVLAYLDMNEYGDALFFAEVFADQVLYDHSEKDWYLWNGHAWKKDATGKVRQLVAGVLGSLYLRAAADLNTEQVNVEQQMQRLQSAGTKETDSPLGILKDKNKALASQMSELRGRAKALRSAKRNASVLTFMQSEMGITSDLWDRDPWALAVPNGVIDLHTGTRRDGDPGDYIRTVCPTEWTSLDASCPRFEHFLAEVFEDKQDREAITAFLHRLLGYGITGSTQDHIFPILYGEEGRNGKDTLLGTLADVLGPIAGAISNDVFIAQDKMKAGGTATPHLCDLQGKRLVWGSETRQGDKLNVALIKQLSGGGEIATRPLYAKDYYTFKPTHKLLLMTNYKPHVDAKDKAAWERVYLIDFGMRFVDRPRVANERQKDATLSGKLKEERSGILAWLVRGCLAWQQQGLAVPESVRLATSKYRDEEDRVLLFIQECCYVAPDAWVKARDLYSAYAKWMEASNLGQGMNIRLFGEDMSKRFEKGRTNAGNIYQGIGLLTCDFARVGSVYSESSPYTPHETASEATPQSIDEAISVGCVGCFPKVPINEQTPPSIEGRNGFYPTHYTRNSSVTLSPTASEAHAEPVYSESSPYTDPTLEAVQHTCATVWEKPQKVAHSADATRFSAGCWWCERCEAQRLLMDVGTLLFYPELRLTHYRIPIGRQAWLRFAQEAGDTRVQQALEVAQQIQQTRKGGSHE